MGARRTFVVTDTRVTAWFFPIAIEQTPEGISMLGTIAIILLVLWLLGMVSSYTLGGFIHILLVVAIVMILVRVISGRNPV
jgi:hypothetical protein